MRKFCIYNLLVICFIFLIQTGSALANESWPKLSGKGMGPSCAEAFRIAKAIFDSDYFYLYDPAAIPEDSCGNLVLRARELNLLDGGPLIVDQSIFTIINKKDESGRIYWQKEVNNGPRLVVAEEAHGWRGFQYYLLSINSSITAEEFLENYGHNKEINGSSLIAQGWRPPLILKMPEKTELWAIDVGEPYIFLNNWKVFSFASDEIKQDCTINFRPQVDKLEDLLPADVIKLAKLLDNAIGRGEDEGTLRRTAVIRTEVMHSWANVAMRPWALTSQPYNSHAEIDSQLERWSRKSKFNHELYKSIRQQYAEAKRALTEYYQSNFELSSNKALEMAVRSLDIVYSKYFIFNSFK